MASKRKHGQHKKACEKYRMENRKERNKIRKAEKRQRILERNKKKREKQETVSSFLFKEVCNF